jgi:hypothetical protein
MERTFLDLTGLIKLAATLGIWVLALCTSTPTMAQSVSSLPTHVVGSALVGPLNFDRVYGGGQCYLFGEAKDFSSRQVERNADVFNYHSFSETTVDINGNEIGWWLPMRPITHDFNGDSYCDLFYPVASDGLHGFIPSELYLFNPATGRMEDKTHLLLENEGVSQSRWVSAADLNNDGIPDMISAEFPEWDWEDFGSVKIWLSNTDSTWTQKTLTLTSRNSSGDPRQGIPTSGGHHGQAVGDIDNDGDLDILVANPPGPAGAENFGGTPLNPSGAFLLENDGSGNFSISQPFAPECTLVPEDFGAQSWLDGIDWGVGHSRECNSHATNTELSDFNNDGYLDLISVTTDHSTNIHYGGPSGLLGSGGHDIIIPTGYQLRYNTNIDNSGPWANNPYEALNYLWPDLDGDGTRDLLILVSRYPEWEWVALLNKGNDTDGVVIWEDVSEDFNTNLMQDGLYDWTYSWGWSQFFDMIDINQDGYLDIVPNYIHPAMAGSGGPKEWAVYGAHHFSEYKYVHFPKIGLINNIYSATDSTGKEFYSFNISGTNLFRQPGEPWSEMAPTVTYDWVDETQGLGFIEICSSDSPWGDTAMPGVSCERHPSSQLVKGGKGTQEGVFPFFTYFVKDTPSSASFVRVRLVDEEGTPSPFSPYTEQVDITEWRPRVSITSTPPSSAIAPISVGFNALVEDFQGDPLTITWDFGDGSPEVAFNRNNGQESGVSHLYNRAGEFVVTATVSDGALSQTDSVRVTIASGVDTESLELPETFVLKAAYPNPFNPTTTVTYGLPVAAEVRITATDLLGRQVATLVAGDMKTAGYHTVQFNAEGLASGTYLIKMEAGDFVATQQVMLLK